MSTKGHKHGSNLSIVEAVETLSSIADLEVDSDIGVAEERQLVLGGQNVPYRSVRWLHKGDSEATLEVAKETFRSILQYLKQFYATQYGKISDEQTAEGIRTIMVLVGEAAQKLDKYTHLFIGTHEASVAECKEYRQLQRFYLTKVAPRIDEGKLGRWILALSQRALEGKSAVKLQQKTESLATKHVFVDLDAVKKDLEYELFFLRKEDGTRFFSPRLIRNIKLVSDFGSCFVTKQHREETIHIDEWLDCMIQRTTSDMVAHLKQRLDNFFRIALHHKGREIVELINKTIMALLLSSSPRHLSSRHPPKNCLAYFNDFQSFLRQIIASRDYQRLIAYPPRSTNQLESVVRDTVVALCRAIYLYGHGLQALHPLISQLTAPVLKEPAVGATPLADRLAAAYPVVQHQLRQNLQGPLAKVLALVFEGGAATFDTLMQYNLPMQEYAFYIGDNRVLYTRMASPTIQEYIHKAIVNDEFKAFLLSCAQGHSVKKHLCIALQDRTSWRESARCHALEALHHHREFGQYLDVAIVAIDTDFYQQKPPYHQDHHTDVFKQHFLEHLCDEQAGFWFPVTMRAALYRSFFPALVDQVHSFFFQDKHILSRESRLVFIDICYLTTIWKLIELSDANAFSLACKDGIDTGPTLGAALFLLYHWLRSSRRSADAEAYVHLQLFAPPLLWRERAPLPESFHRFVSLLRHIEHCRSELGEEAFYSQFCKRFGSLYEWPWFEGEVNWPVI